MNIIKKIILFITNIFNKQEKPKTLELPKQVISKEKRSDFIESLKITTLEREKHKKIQTLICEGDGLGIQKKISY